MARFVVLAVLAATTTAHASPLEPLWDVGYQGNCDSAMFALDGKLAILHDRTLVPVDPATGKLGKPRRLHGSHENVQHGRSWGWALANASVVDGVIVVFGGHWIGGYDAMTGKELWLREPDGGGLPTLRTAGTALIAERPARLGPGDPGVMIEHVDPHTGAPHWTTELPSRYGQLGHEALDADRLYVFTSPSYGSPHSFISAVELATGKLAWSVEVVAPAGQASGVSNVAISDAGLILDVPGEGLRVLDATTGKEQRRIAVAVGSLVVHGARVYVALADQIAAYDGTTGRRAWSVPIAADRAALDTDGAFLFAHDDHETVHALDLATGTELASWGTAGQELVYVHAGAGAGAPTLVLCGDGRLIALDPSAPVRPVEHATISGAITCTGCNHDVPPADTISVAGADLPLARGRYRTTFEGRGRIAIYAEPADLSVARSGIEYDLTMCHRVLALTGRGRYTLDCRIRVTHNHF